MELRMQRRGLLTEDFERTRAILRGNDEELLALLHLMFIVGSIGFQKRARCDQNIPAHRRLLQRRQKKVSRSAMIATVLAPAAAASC